MDCASPWFMKRVVILGASPKKERTSNQAFHLLRERGYQVLPVNPNCEEIDGMRCLQSLGEISPPVDTISIYLKAELALPLVSQMLALKPKRVILNPGTESVELKEGFEKAGVPVFENCTLVLLKTNQF